MLDDKIQTIMWNGTSIRAPEMKQLLTLMCTERANEDRPGEPPLRAWSCCSVRNGPIVARGLQVLDSRMTCILRPCNVQLEAILTRHGPAADDLERSLRIGKVFGPLAIAHVQGVTVRLRQFNRGIRIPALFPTRRLQIRALADEFLDRILVDEAAASGWSWGPKRDDPYDA